MMNEMTTIAPATTGADADGTVKRDYFVRREAQERRLVERATDPVARRVHAELAKRYAELIGNPA
jgi:hypothetical protein